METSWTIWQEFKSHVMPWILAGLAIYAVHSFYQVQFEALKEQTERNTRAVERIGDHIETSGLAVLPQTGTR